MIYSYVYSISTLLSIALLYRLYKVRRSEIGKMLAVITGLVMIWLLMESLTFYVGNDEIIIFLQKFKYISIICIPPLMFITCYGFVKGNKNILHFRFLLLFILPLISMVSLFTNCFPYAFMESPHITYDLGFPVYHSHKLIGFIVHSVYSYVVSFMANMLLFYNAVKSSRIYRRQSFFIFIGSFMSVVISAIFITEVIGAMPIDTTPIFVLFTMAIFYWGVYILPANKLIPKARNLVIENMSDLVVIVDNKDCIIDINPAAKIFLKDRYSLFNEKNTAGVSLHKLLGELFEDGHKIEAVIKNELKEVEIRHKNECQYFQVGNKGIIDDQNVQIGKVYFMHNITKLQKNMNDLIKLNEELTVSDTILNDALEAIVITNEENEIIKVNQSMIKISGYEEEELIGNNPSMLKSDKHDDAFYYEMWKAITKKGFWEGEIWDKRKNGEIYPKWMSITVVRDKEGKITRYVSISSDITKIKKAEEDVHKLAYYDSLTELPNRALFNDRLTTAFSRVRRNHTHLALLYIDLDRFKDINDSLGHSAGDELLMVVAGRIKKCIRDVDTLARLGGDEFTVIMEGLSDIKEAEIIAENILEELRSTFVIHHSEVTIVASIGIAVAPDDDETEEGLMRKADLAMYHAKEHGGNRYFFSSEELEKFKRRINKLSAMLKNAINIHQFELYLQPQVCRGESGYELVGAEALIRWPQSDGSMIPPDEFIPLAEKNGLIHPIGLWVFKEVQRINRLLQRAGIDINLSLNVSIKQFENPQFIGKVKKIMAQNVDVPIDLTVEITESLFFNDLEKGISDLNELKGLGMRIALDDFGTGFSSLSYLNRLPIDYVKIDKSFVDEIEPTNNKSLAYMMLSMAHTLELEIVAEGIEEKYQADYLFDAGCDIVQGYYYSKPIPVKEFMEYAASISKTIRKEKAPTIN